MNNINIIRATTYTVMGKGGHIYDEGVTTVSIEDEGGGEFFSIQQEDMKLEFNIEEWPVICAAVEKIISTIQFYEIIQKTTL